ncbi:MAG TPA: hypothetical protein VKZ53_12975 [Candidatus Angelobacter sp.]|nr:hypothetical protein [Candidatus Angelobacter sp.]
MDRTPPTKAQIDELVDQYTANQNAASFFHQMADGFSNQLIALVREHGSAPPKTTKSLRLAGDVYEVTVSFRSLSPRLNVSKKVEKPE